MQRAGLLDGLTVVVFCGISPVSLSQARKPPQSPTSQLPTPAASKAQPVRGLQLPIQPSGTLTLTRAPGASSKPPPATGMLLRVDGQVVKLQALMIVKVRFLHRQHSVRQQAARLCRTAEAAGGQVLQAIALVPRLNRCWRARSQEAGVLKPLQVPAGCWLRLWGCIACTVRAVIKP